MSESISESTETDYRDRDSDEQNSEPVHLGTRQTFTAVLNQIKAAKALGAISIDLSQKRLTDLPPELFGVETVEFLYLEGNFLESVPDELFQKLTNLKWLDLRFNQIRKLPPTIGQHRCLKNLLLEGNVLAELPPELGLVKTLTGLNLRNNPLEFPPSRIIAKGAKEILRYLRDALAVKGQNLKAGDLKIEDLNISDSGPLSSESDSEYTGSKFSSANETHNQANVIPGRNSVMSMASNPSDLEFPRPKSVSLHRHLTYEEYRQMQYEKFKRAGALGLLGKEKRKRKKKKKVKSPGPIYIDPIQSRFMEEKRLAKLKELKEKQALAEQRLKDQRLLEDWRDESKEMQRKHYIRAIKNKQTSFVDPLHMPYDTDPSYMQVVSKEERIKMEVKQEHERMKQRDPEYRQRADKARFERDKQLMAKIKDHTQRVQERKHRPKGNPREEMEAAKRDLELANQLRSEVTQRNKELEYRFRAFTGDTSPVMSPRGALRK